MGVIHVMDAHLSNMIAAGEVVDRPVNIVKECAENALDAGATTVDIEVFNGGIDGIVITDNGCGMDREDAVLAFSRHATSKLTSEEDLFNIQTMGFRGEALASIAAVARVDLQTNNGKEGSHVRYEYGQQTVSEEFSCKRGTRIEITGLFLHTPARFKYLKRGNYEFSIIADTVNKLAISHPDIRFTLRHDNRMVFQTSGKGNQKEILFAMYGREVAENAVSFYGESDDFSIQGLAVQPKISRANKNFIYLSINDRLVRSYPLQKAVIEAYREYLPKERFPIVFLNVQVDAQLVDVNVHPNKLEVRISKEEYLVQLIINTIENLFASQLHTPEVSIERIKTPAPTQESLDFHYAPYIESEIQIQDQTFNPAQKKSNIHTASSEINITNSNIEEEHQKQQNLRISDQSYEQKMNNGEDVFGQTYGGHPHIQEYGKDNHLKQEAYLKENQVPIKPVKDEIREQFQGSIPIRLPSEDLKSETSVSTKALENKNSAQKGKEFFSHLKIIGQLKDSYILCENADGLVIIDQHAAQERYNFEKIEEQFQQPCQTLQPRMIPLRISVSSDVFCRLEDVNEAAGFYGLHFESFGNNQWILRQEPGWFMNMDQERFLEDLIAWFKKHDQVDMNELRRHMIATKACHSSIRFNRPLTMMEMEKVIEDLKQCKQPYHCPHGRPTVITLSDVLLRKEFERG